MATFYNNRIILALLTSLILIYTAIFSPQSLAKTPLAKQDKVLIYIRDDVYIDYLKFIDNKEATSIADFSGKSIRRDVVDMIIAQQALKLGGFEYKFDYAPGKVNFRNTKMLKTGQLLISFDSYWKKDADMISDQIYISEPVIKNGEYVAGIYTSPKNQQVLTTKTKKDLQKLTAVSTPQWRTDWQTLKSLSLKELIEEDSWLSMARMVSMQWVDFLLMPFNSTKDQSFTMEKIHLVPVKGIGIVLNDSRHFVISKTHPQGKEAFIAINKGIKILRQRGDIHKAYLQAGFFIDTKKTKVINR